MLPPRYVFYVWIMLACQSAGLLGSELTCVINYKSWLVPRDINFRWTSIDLDLETLSPDSYNVNVNWTSYGFWGTLPNVTATSCACAYNPALGECMDFGEPFTLLVSVRLKNQSVVFQDQWQIDPVNCEKPPPVDDFNVTVVDSHSVNVSVTWSPRQPFPSAMISRYSVLYRKSGMDEWIENQNDVSWSTTGISSLVFGLSPFTKYEFTVTCRKLDSSGSPYGHSSDVISVTEARTAEAPPSVAPEFCAHCFSFVNDDSCMRDMILYWTDIPEEAKNGRILKFHLVVTNTSSESTFSSKYSVPGQVFRFQMSLTCRQLYTVNLRAENAAGWSGESSISINASEASPVQEIIPEADYNETGISVSWTQDESVMAARGVLGSVVWCLKDTTGECDKGSAITTVPQNQFSLDLPSNHSIGRYRVGVANDVGGIVWAKCIYYKPEAITKLSSTLHVTSDNMPPRTLLVQWTTPSCDQVEPVYYISGFVLKYCVCSDDGLNCTELGNSITLNNTVSTYVIEALNPGDHYLITLLSLDRNGRLRTLSSSNGFCAPGKADFGVLVWIGIALSVIITLGCALFMVTLVRKTIRRRWSMEIVLPDLWSDHRALITEL